MKKMFYLLIFISINAQSNELAKFFKGKWELNEKSLQYLKDGEILTDAIVESKGSDQEFSLKAAGWHNKKCSLVLRKLSMLEKYQDWISFIKSSTYQEKAKLFTLRADHALLPYPMIVHIIMDRPTKPGVYPFSFPTGIFAGLTGKYIIEEKNDRCLIFATSYWKGPKTKIPNIVVDLFAETLTKTGAQLLIRKTQL